MEELFGREKGQYNPLTWGSRVKAGTIGFLAGMGLHQAGAMIKDKYAPEKEFVHGKDIGVVTAFASLTLPESEAKYVIGGLGSGIAIHDVVWHILKRTDIKPVFFGDQKEPLLRYYKCYKVDPTLPIQEKEKLILPIIPRTVREMQNRPEQIMAIKRILMMAGVGLQKRRINLTDVKKLQKWILQTGTYTANEGLWYGHDRFRTAGKLINEYDTEPKMMYDCDDWGITFNQIMNYYGYPYFTVFVSQRTVPNPRWVQNAPVSNEPRTYNALHHVLPAVHYKGEFWLVEGIKPLPIIPLRFAHTVFKGLKRITMVDMQGRIWDDDSWKMEQRMATKHGVGYGKRYPGIAKYISSGMLSPNKNYSAGHPRSR